MNIMQYMAHEQSARMPGGDADTNKKAAGGIDMEEKVYKTMGGTGAWNIVLGIVVLTVGVASGVLLIIGGAKLLAARSKVLF